MSQNVRVFILVPASRVDAANLLAGSLDPNAPGNTETFGDVRLIYPDGDGTYENPDFYGTSTLLTPEIYAGMDGFAAQIPGAIWATETDAVNFDAFLTANSLTRVFLPED